MFSILLVISYQYYNTKIIRRQLKLPIWQEMLKIFLQYKKFGFKKVEFLIYLIFILQNFNLFAHLKTVRRLNILFLLAPADTHLLKVMPHPVG